MAVLLMTGGYLYLPVNGVKLRAGSAFFPQAIGPWHSDGALLDDLSVVGADVSVLRQYKNGDGSPIELYLAYFESQAQAKELAGDRTERFLLGDNPLENGRVSLQGLEARQIIQRRGHTYRVIVCWYEIDGQPSGETWRVVLRTIQNGVLHRRTNGAVVIVATEYERPDQLPHEMERLNTFIQTALPEIRAFLITT